MIYNISGLTRKYRDRVVLDIPELELTGGRIHALLGPNGSGKTTLLNLLALLDTPSGGTIMFQGQEGKGPESSLLAMRRKVVLVDQYPIFFSRSVLQNLEFGLKIRKIAKAARRQMIEQALEMVGMADFIKAPAHTLSGGENKRAALARGMVLQPEVLLCDEPFANVDTENQELIFHILKKINKDHGITIIFSSHDRPRAELLADETWYLENGLLSEKSMANTVEAEATDAPGRYRLIIPGKEILINGPNVPGVRPKEKCRLQLDSRKINLLPLTHSTAHSEGISGTVQSIELRGQHIEIIVNIGINIHLSFTAPQYHATPPLVGQRVQLIIPSSAIHWKTPQ